MLSIFKTLVFLLIITGCVGCSDNDKATTGMSTHKSVDIELSIPHTEGLPVLYPNSEDSKISVIVYNRTDSAVRMYEDWNSWGYYNFSFEIETPDSIYHVQRTKRGWWKNFPSYHVINPGETLVFNFKLDGWDSESSSGKRSILRGSAQGWSGLPVKDYDSAKIRVLYELKEEVSLSLADSSVVKETIVRSFPVKLVSRQYDIKITVPAYQCFTTVTIDTSNKRKTPE
jgi:hypothetical protein